MERKIDDVTLTYEVTDLFPKRTYLCYQFRIGEIDSIDAHHLAKSGVWMVAADQNEALELIPKGRRLEFLLEERFGAHLRYPNRFLGPPCLSMGNKCGRF